MGDPLFMLKLVYPDGSAIKFKGAGLFERNLVTAITEQVMKDCVTPLVKAIQERGVGFTRTEAHVLQDAKDAILQTLPGIVTGSVKDVLLELKKESVKLV